MLNKEVLMENVANLTDPAPYYAICAGVKRFGAFANVRAWAVKELTDWASLGYRRTASIYYRDGSVVERLMA